MSVLRVTYDPSVDAAYLYMRESAPGEATRSQSVVVHGRTGDCSLSFDTTATGELIGIEVLDASDLLPHALLEAAARIG